MKKNLLLAILILTFAAISNAQTTAPSDELTISQQRLEKVLTDLDKSEAEKKSLERENAALLKLDATNNALLNAKDALLKSKESELDVFRKIKCSKTSFLFGLISKKTCY